MSRKFKVYLFFDETPNQIKKPKRCNKTSSFEKEDSIGMRMIASWQEKYIGS